MDHNDDQDRGDRESLWYNNNLYPRTVESLCNTQAQWVILHCSSPGYRASLCASSNCNISFILLFYFFVVNTDYKICNSELFIKFTEQEQVLLIPYPKALQQ